MGGRKRKWTEGRVKMTLEFGSPQADEIDAACELISVQGYKKERKITRAEFFREGARALCEEMKRNRKRLWKVPMGERPHEAIILSTGVLVWPPAEKS